MHKKQKDKTISLNWQEINFLHELIRQQGEALQQSLLAIGRLTPRLEAELDLISGLSDKLEAHND